MIEIAKKVFGLFSGGLDSILACKIICDLGFDVEALYFSTLFQKKKSFDGLPADYFFDCPNGNFKIRTIDINDKYLDMLINPKFGYGKNINPCIDCKILFLNEAIDIMRAENGLFVFTGEVLGQRPKSQKKNTLLQISKNTSAAGYIVRPLCGKLLPATLPEIKGLIKRDDLLDISGRSRKRQMELAEQFGLRNFGQPAGGCLLTDKIYSLKLRHLIDNNFFNKKQIEYLRIGRNFCFDDKYKIIIGRDENENNLIEQYSEANDVLFTVDDIPGPTGIILSGAKDIDNDALLTTAKLTAKYSDSSADSQLKVRAYNKINHNLFEMIVDRTEIILPENLVGL